MSRLPTVKPREAVAALKKAGFLEHHQRGSHLYLWHPAKHRMTSVPMHPGDLHRGLLKAILKQADLSEAEFRELL
jgi:predicted RNA binding protein YcfA (HicA-like mRNA interferase family)